MNNTKTLTRLSKKIPQSYNKDRICSQLSYAIRLSANREGKYDALISKALAALEAAYASEGALTASTVKHCEELLAPMADDCKALSLCAIGHAHIDMNWMWRYDETVSITLETFRTVLRLMEEYDFFTFGQSQASVYEIVEKFEPEMLPKIKARIQEGRWEVLASTWVETDKNMPSSESYARHALYTKRYLSELLDLQDEQFLVDFEPDTFGHNINVPETLANAGVKYYYHCRGNGENEVYNYRSPSGAQVLVYREPDWYLGSVDYGYAAYVPDFCKRNQLDEMLLVYGVGDHGGGPTRRDLERLHDMMQWPIFPTIYCGSFHDYFKRIEKNAHLYPVVEHELNVIFTGCYTSQSKIKEYDAVCSRILGEAELFSAMATSFVPGFEARNLEEYWRHVLFNHFHDILPGSGVDATREYASGIYQIALAGGTTEKSRALRAISDRIDTLALLGPENTIDPESTSEGAGVGFKTKDYFISPVERNSGIRRAYHLFNSGSCICDNAEMTLWDWQGDPKFLKAFLADGSPVEAQVLESGVNKYWGHSYIRLLVNARVKPFAWQSIVIDECIQDAPIGENMHEFRVHKAPSYSLENEYLLVEIDGCRGCIAKITDKSSGEVLCEEAGLSYSLESPQSGMTSWVTGRFMGESKPILPQRIQWEAAPESKPLAQILKIQGKIGQNSNATLRLILEKGSKTLKIEAETAWTEIGSAESGIPNLSFNLPLSYEAQTYRYDVAFGTVDRRPTQDDTPALSFGCALPVKRQKALLLSAEGKHGFRGFENTLSLSLLRSSYDPDPYPEVGNFKTKLYLTVVEETAPSTLIQTAKAAAQTVELIAAYPHPGNLPAEGSFIELSGAMISALKCSESGDGFILRVFEPGDGDSVGDSTAQEVPVSVKLPAPVQSAVLCDFHEQELGPVPVEGDRISFNLGKGKVATVFFKL